MKSKFGVFIALFVPVSVSISVGLSAALSFPREARAADNATQNTSLGPRQLRLPDRLETRKLKAPQVNQRILLIRPAADVKPLDLKSLKKKTQSAASSVKNNVRTGVWSRGDAPKTTVREADPDTVLPKGEEPEEDLPSSIKSMGGDIIDVIGHGAMAVWVVKFDSNLHFLEAEKRFTSDERVKSLQRDYIFHANVADANAVNDPYFASQWYMDALNVLPAWKLSKGGPNTIGIIDSGTDTQIGDLKDKSFIGFDAVTNKINQKDVQGHGTMVATTAAAAANNGVGTAGPATLSKIYPVRVGFADGTVSVSAIIKAISQSADVGVKILNISSNGDPPYSFAHEKFNRVLHDYLEWYHDRKGGLVFNAAGNSGTRDSSRLQPYLIVVSALNENYALAGFSTYGRCVWFTAPGTNITCSGPGGKIATVAGTSFSSPLAASIAALLWGAKPSLRNTQVEQVMIETCLKAKREWTQYFGFGLPDAEAAMKKILGQ